MTDWLSGLLLAFYRCHQLLLNCIHSFHILRGAEFETSLGLQIEILSLPFSLSLTPFLLPLPPLSGMLQFKAKKPRLSKIESPVQSRTAHN